MSAAQDRGGPSAGAAPKRERAPGTQLFVGNVSH